jgi:hypothetical protein
LDFHGKCHILILCKSFLIYLSRGAWVAANVLASDLAEEFTCAALPHPSLTLEEKMYGGNLPDLMSKIDRPILLMPTAVSFRLLISYSYFSLLYLFLLFLSFLFRSLLFEG